MWSFGWVHLYFNNRAGFTCLCLCAWMLHICLEDLIATLNPSSSMCMHLGICIGRGKERCFAHCIGISMFFSFSYLNSSPPFQLLTTILSFPNKTGYLHVIDYFEKKLDLTPWKWGWRDRICKVNMMERRDLILKDVEGFLKTHPELKACRISTHMRGLLICRFGTEVKQCGVNLPNITCESSSNDLIMFTIHQFAGS